MLMLFSTSGRFLELDGIMRVGSYDKSNVVRQDTSSNTSPLSHDVREQEGFPDAEQMPVAAGSCLPSL